MSAGSAESSDPVSAEEFAAEQIRVCKLRKRVASARAAAEAALREYGLLQHEELAGNERLARMRLCRDQVAGAEAALVFHPERRVCWTEYGRRKLVSIRSGGDGGKGQAGLLYYEARALRHAEWDTQVAKDVPRSLGSLGLPACGEEVEDSLRRALRAWIARSKEERLGTGYVQGMNLRCALPCAFLGLSDASFGLCALAIEDLGVPGTFSSWPPLEGLMVAREQLAEEVELRLPRLAAALGQSLEGLMGLLAPHWLIPLFVGAVPTSLVVRIWDDLIAARQKHGVDGQFAALRWVVSLLAHFEEQVCERLEGLGEEFMADIEAFKLVQAGALALPFDWVPPAVVPWDSDAVRRRHAELLQLFRADLAESRLSRRCALSAEQVSMLRSEFEQLRRRRWMEVDVEADENLGIEFAAGTHIVVAVRRGMPMLTGWRLTAIGGAPFGAKARLAGPWREWQVRRWEWQSDRHGGWEAFAVADACLLEANYLRGRGRLETRALSFNTEVRHLYTYDFSDMLETNSDAGTRRNIRRLPGWAGEVVRHWSMSGKHEGKVRLHFEAGGELHAYQSQVWNARRKTWEPPRGQAEWNDIHGAPIGCVSPSSQRRWGMSMLGGGSFSIQRRATNADERPTTPPLDDLSIPPVCRWDGTWRVDQTVGDAEGWLYAAAKEKSMSDCPRDGDTYRRRRWVRMFLPAIEMDGGDDAAAEHGVTLQELGAVMARVCPGFPLECLPTFFTLLDVKNRRLLTLSDLTEGLSLMAEQVPESKLKILFDLYDDDADEKIGDSELRRLCESVWRAATRRRRVGATGATIRTALPNAPGADGSRQRPLAEGTVVTITRQVDADHYEVQWFQGTKLREGIVGKASLSSVTGDDCSPQALIASPVEERPAAAAATDLAAIAEAVADVTEGSESSARVRRKSTRKLSVDQPRIIRRKSSAMVWPGGQRRASVAVADAVQLHADPEQSKGHSVLDANPTELSDFKFGEGIDAESSGSGSDSPLEEKPGPAPLRRRSFWRESFRGPLRRASAMPPDCSLEVEEEKAVSRMITHLCGLPSLTGSAGVLDAHTWNRLALQETIFWRALLEAGTVGEEAESPLRSRMGGTVRFEDVLLKTQSS